MPTPVPTSLPRFRAWAILALAAGLLAGCGGGGGSTAAPLPNTVQNLAGVWTGTWHSNTTGQDSAVSALILPSGAFWFLDAQMATTSGTATLNGTSLGGQFLMFPEWGGTVPGDNPMNAILGGQATAQQVAATFYGSDRGTINLTPAPAMNIQVALATLAGTYSATATSSTGTPTTLNVATDGTITGTTSRMGVNLNLTGRLVQTSPDLASNAFTVTLDEASGTPGTYTLHYNGLAFYIPAAAGSAGRPQLCVMSQADGYLISISGVFTSN